MKKVAQATVDKNEIIFYLNGLISRERILITYWGLQKVFYLLLVTVIEQVKVKHLKSQQNCKGKHIRHQIHPHI